MKFKIGWMVRNMIITFGDLPWLLLFKHVRKCVMGATPMIFHLTCREGMHGHKYDYVFACLHLKKQDILHPLQFCHTPPLVIQHH